MNKSIFFTSASHTRSCDLFSDFFLEQQLDHINPVTLQSSFNSKADSNQSRQRFKTSFPTPGASQVSPKKYRDSDLSAIFTFFQRFQ